MVRKKDNSQPLTCRAVVTVVAVCVDVGVGSFMYGMFVCILFIFMSSLEGGGASARRKYLVVLNGKGGAQSVWPLLTAEELFLARLRRA